MQMAGRSAIDGQLWALMLLDSDDCLYEDSFVKMIARSRTPHEDGYRAGLDKTAVTKLTAN
jgi:hypothetical protein